MKGGGRQGREAYGSSPLLHFLREGHLVLLPPSEGKLPSGFKAIFTLMHSPWRGARGDCSSCMGGLFVPSPAGLGGGRKRTYSQLFPELGV